jgi:hypothetical protein
MAADLDVKVPIFWIAWKQARAADKPIGAFVDDATDTLWRMRLGNGSMAQPPWAFPARVFAPFSSIARG